LRAVHPDRGLHGPRGRRRRRERGRKYLLFQGPGRRASAHGGARTTGALAVRRLGRRAWPSIPRGRAARGGCTGARAT
jgi:hypothetical protein